ncbi:hypothetical protein BJ875DRAFT_512567 [Amylocarpus encephaloides]|uniref:Uncharacterized protein n=1 Tax=Amylocarpus encephaloides TaxID=45428 RepID=A0A9P7YH41_9HELO|nr:hypothetical protein BJ875DRAFT_512567 [Amylocarpus encephaloides]
MLLNRLPGFNKQPHRPHEDFLQDNGSYSPYHSLIVMNTEASVEEEDLGFVKVIRPLIKRSKSGKSTTKPSIDRKHPRIDFLIINPFNSTIPGSRWLFRYVPYISKTGHSKLGTISPRHKHLVTNEKILLLTFDELTFLTTEDVISDLEIEITPLIWNRDKSNPVTHLTPIRIFPRPRIRISQRDRQTYPQPWWIFGGGSFEFVAESDGFAVFAILVDGDDPEFGLEVIEDFGDDLGLGIKFEMGTRVIFECISPDQSLRT